MINCMNSKNADLNAITNNVDASQRNNKVKLKCLHNNKKKIVNIIELLIKISTLEKEKSKDYL